jgi:hypothetical protein
VVPVRVVPSAQKPSPQQSAVPRPQLMAIKPAEMPKFAPVPVTPPPAPPAAPVAPQVAPASNMVTEKPNVAQATEKLATEDGLAAVDYRQGLLSVVSEHATLDKVLDLVGGKIGATIELSNDLAKESVVARLGPASPSEVLHDLLDGPTVDYIIMGGDQINRVIVRRRQSFGRQPLAGPPQHRDAVAAMAQSSAEPSHQENQKQDAENTQPQGDSNPPR